MNIFMGNRWPRRLGELVLRSFRFTLLTVLSLLLATDCRAEEATLWLQSWGVNIEKLPRLSEYTRANGQEMFVRSAYRQGNKIFLHVEVLDLTRQLSEAKPRKSFLVNFETGEVEEVEPKARHGLVELPPTDSVSHGLDSIFSQDTCGRYSLYSGIWTGGDEFFLMRRVILPAPKEFPMSRGRCAEEFYDSNAPTITTRYPIVAGDVEFVDLGDGTVLAWDFYWASDIIRFSISDGKTKYTPTTVSIVPFSQVQMEFFRSQFKPEKFFKYLENIIDGVSR